MGRMITRFQFYPLLIAACVISWVCMMTPFLYAQSGYITKNGGATQYSSLYAANPQNDDVITVKNGDVVGGGVVVYTSNSEVTLQSDVSNMVRQIRANNNQLFSVKREVELTLNIENLNLTSGDGPFGGLIGDWIDDDSLTVTINGAEASFTNSKASFGGAIYSETVNLNGSNTFSENKSGSTGGAIYCTNINISGSNTFTDNTAQHFSNAYGGAIRASGNIVFKGKNSTATFSNNIVTVGSTQHMNDIYAEDNITIQDGGRYTFNGGITTAKPQEGVPPFQTFTIQDHSNVTFGTGSSTIIKGTTKLDNAHLTIQGGASTTFNVGALEIEGDSQNSIVFEHSWNNEGTVMEGTGLEALSDTAIFVELTDAKANQFAYVSEITDTAVTTSEATGTAAFNLVQNNVFVGSSDDMGGTYGGKTIQSGDTIIVTNNRVKGTALPKQTSDLTLTIQSNTNDVRTITTDTKEILTGKEKITLNLNQIRFNCGDASGTGAFINSKQVVINGSGKVNYNDASGDNGGAISAVDTVEINGTIQFIDGEAQTGLNFDANYATNGGAISGNTVKISGSNAYIDNNNATYANEFSRNKVTGPGGAIYASGSVSLSGSNLFDHNESGSIGGAIFSEGSVSITGVNTFKKNTADDDGGAIWAKDNVTFSGKDSKTTFSGNKANGKNNDVFSQEGNITFNGGKHTFGGGLVANGGTINVSNGANVYLENGSISSAQSLTIDGDSMLKIDLNANNKVSALNKTNVTNGATKLFLTRTGTIGAESRMDVTLDKTTGMTNGYYLVAAGNFSGNDTGKVLFNTRDYEESRISATATGLYVGVLINSGIVSRSDASGKLNMADTFDGAFEDGLGAVATGNVITLEADVNAKKEVSLGADVTELTIQSDDSAQQRTVTATGTLGHRFLNFEGDATVNTTNITFQDGGDDSENGGAIFSGGNLTVNGSAEAGGNATEFKNNKAENGGALKAGNVTLGGNLKFEGNNANEAGGAIYATGNITFAEGSETVFSGNTMKNGANETPNDLFVSSGVITVEKDATVSFDGGIDGGMNTSMVINEGAHVTFSDGAVLNIGGGMRIDSSDVTFGDDVGMNFQRGVVVGAGISQVMSGKVTISEQLGVTFDPKNSSVSFIDLRETSDLTISDGTAVKIYNAAGDVISAKDFKGITDTQTLVYGKDDCLANVGGAESYESVLYRVNIGLDGQNFVVTSEKKDVDLDTIEGNAQAATALFGDDILDVETVEEARENVVSATGEVFASAAHAQSQRMTYLNRMVANRLMNMQTCGQVENDSANVWFTGYGMGGNAVDHDHYSGYAYNAYGTMLGTEYVNTENIRIGFYYGYGRTELKPANSSQLSTDHTVGFYGQWDSVYFGGYTFGLGALSFSDNAAGRSYSDQSLSDHYNSFAGTFYVEKGWRYASETFGMWNPYISVQYFGYNSDDITNQTLSIRDNRYDSFRSQLGLRYTIGTEYFCFTSGASWLHEWLDENASFQMTNNAVTERIFGNGTGRDWFEGTLGVQCTLLKNLTLSADYYLFVNDVTTLHGGMGTLIYRF